MTKDLFPKMSKRTLGLLAFSMTSILWGTTFVVLKNVSQEFSPSFLLSIRYAFALIAIFPIAYPTLKKLDKKTWLYGFLMGFTMWASNITQTAGIYLGTTPGKSAFITTSYCIIVPFLYWAFTRIKPEKTKVIASILCLIGVGIISLSGDLSIKTGDFLTLVTGVALGTNMVLVAIFCHRKDGNLLIFLQVFFVWLLSVITCVATNAYPESISISSVLGTAYLGVFATTGAFIFQVYGFKHSNATSGAIILATHAPIAVLLSIIFYGEVLNAKTIIGFIVIFIAVILSEITFRKPEVNKTKNILKSVEK